MILYHGTHETSATALLEAFRLDSSKALSLKIDGPKGFFLAFDRTDAEFFALRRGRGVVVELDVSNIAMERLFAVGAVRRQIPIGARSPAFVGDELFVPIAEFEAFNALIDAGEIAISTND
jgi:hypothetical protein